MGVVSLQSKPRAGTPAKPVPTRTARPTVRTTVATATPTLSVHKKEDEKHRGAAARSPARNSATTTTNTATLETRVIPVTAEVDRDEARTQNDAAQLNVKKSNQNETPHKSSSEEEELGISLSNMTLDDSKDLNLQLQNLTISDKKQDEEESEDSDLVSRGPDRLCAKPARPAPYEQHILSSDNNGGATVLCRNISQGHQFIGPNYVPDRGICATNWQHLNRDGGAFTPLNFHNVPADNFKEPPNSDLQKLPSGTSETYLQFLSEVDLKIIENVVRNKLHEIDIEEVINEKADEEAVERLKQELFEGGIDKQNLPHSPDSGYGGEESPMGSPLSTTTTLSRTDSEKNDPLGSPCPVIIPPTNFVTQSGPVAASIPAVIQTVQPTVLLMLPQQPGTIILPSPPPPMQSQPLAPASTPPLSPHVRRRTLLPGVSMPPPCNEPAINRVKCLMNERAKDTAWALVFAKEDSDFTSTDDDGNTLLCHALSCQHKLKYFMEVLHAVIQRLRCIIGNDRQMAQNLLGARNKNDLTPLDIACRSLLSGAQDALAVRYLADTMVQEGLLIGEEVDKYGNTLLHRICMYGDKARFIMAELLSMKDKRGASIFDVNKANSEGETPLHVAARKHSGRCSYKVLAQLLLCSGAAASKQEGHAGNTVLHCVARESCDPDLLVMMLANTSNVQTVINKVNYNGDTPLHMVAANHSISLNYQRLAVQHLIHYGADPRIQNKSGKAPLSLVAGERKQDIKTVLYHHN